MSCLGSHKTEIPFWAYNTWEISFIFSIVIAQCTWRCTVKPTHVKQSDKQISKPFLCSQLHVNRFSFKCIICLLWGKNWPVADTWLFVFGCTEQKDPQSVKSCWWYRTVAGCCENSKAIHILAHLWQGFGVPWESSTEVDVQNFPPPSLLLVSCWDLNKPKDYLRAFKCKF